MKLEVFLALIAFLACAAYATHGSISEGLFEDDIKDEPYAEEDNLDEPPAILKERRRNPCMRHKCRRGEKCVLDADRKPECKCNTDCTFYEKSQSQRYQVCSNRNQTYATECNLNADHCLCKFKLPGCSEPGVKKIYLEYYGHCQEDLPCPEGNAAQFPVRMRNWLFVIMEAMAQRAAIGEYADLVAPAGKDEHHAYAVIWKFCDLDTDPQDRRVSKRELQYTVRSLRAMEGCLVPFLDKCDANDDKKISLQEWGQCLGLDKDEIIDKCHKIHKNKKNGN